MMKHLQVIVFLSAISSSLAIAQPKSIITTHPQNPAIETLQYSSSNKDFYENNNGSMHLMMSNEYVGPSFSYFNKTNSRLQFGLNSGIVPIVRDKNVSPEYYMQDEQYRLLLIPFWLSVKIRLRSNIDDKLIPYFIGGLGPTLGLGFGSNNGFIDSITYLRGEVGGGGYLGLGFDYLWAEEWAISLEARYNVFVFDHPLGDDKEFEGFSFFIGFVRAFGL